MKRGKDYIGVGVGAVILNDKNEVLLLQRNKEPEKGFWSIPGGAVEFNETIEDALIREIKEETDVDVEIIKLLSVVNHIVKSDSAHWVSPNFLCKIISGTVKNVEPNKHTDIQWFSLNDLPDNITITTKKGIESLNYKGDI